MGMSHGKGTSYFVALPPREWGQHLVNHGLSKKKNGGCSLPRLWKRSTVPNPLEHWRQRHLLKNRSKKNLMDIPISVISGNDPLVIDLHLFKSGSDLKKIIPQLRGII